MFAYFKVVIEVSKPTDAADVKSCLALRTVVHAGDMAKRELDTACIISMRRCSFIHLVLCGWNVN